MADVQHNTQDTTNLHKPGYVQASDPGAIGAGKLWIDTSAGTGLWVTKIRNATDDGWEIAGAGSDGTSGYSGAQGISGYSGAGGGAGASYNVAITNADLVAGIFTAPHNLGSRYPLVIIYDSAFKAVVPDEIQSVDVNTVTIDLSSFSPLVGTWNIKVLG